MPNGFTGSLTLAELMLEVNELNCAWQEGMDKLAIRLRREHIIPFCDETGWEFTGNANQFIRASGGTNPEFMILDKTGVPRSIRELMDYKFPVIGDDRDCSLRPRSYAPNSKNTSNA